jgi:hypothetical protein
MLVLGKGTQFSCSVALSRIGQPRGREGEFADDSNRIGLYPAKVGHLAGQINAAKRALSLGTLKACAAG